MIIICLVLALVGLMVGCKDFLESPEITTDPNIAANVMMNELITAIQARLFGNITATPAIFVQMWMQQMAGVDQHYAGYDYFNVNTDQFDAMWFDVYGSGGLTDIRILRNKAEEQGRNVYAGLARMYESLSMSTAADLWGDIPYSQAVNPSDYPDPVYDSQSSVHDAILDLLDEAIANFQAAVAADEYFDSSYDFSFGGDMDKWIAAAHTLKARILLNGAEVQPGNYALALAEAQQGIASEAGDWKTVHTTTIYEETPHWQFYTKRFGYVMAGNFLVELLKTHQDPRVEIYYGLDDAGGYSGSQSGEGNGTVSWLNEDYYGAEDWDGDMVTWYENQFIIAECQLAGGDSDAALATLNDVIQPGLEDKFGLEANSLPRYGPVGITFLEAIMVEKYKAMFLNIQVWSDWRRTNYPVFDHVFENRDIPRRFLWCDDERNTNDNFPTGNSLYDRVENDPN